MKFGLRGKLLLAACSLLLVSLTISISVITINTFKATQAEALEKTFIMTEKFRNQVQIEMNTALNTARNVALAMAGLKSKENIPDRAELNQMLKNVLEGNPELMGLWTVWEPNALDGNDLYFKNTEAHDETGRYIAYWNRVGGLHIEACVEYEDGTQTGYYTYPRATGKELVTEPTTYEIGGKPVTVVSACVPVMVDGKFVGLVGADFSMEKMEQLIAGINAYDNGYGSLITDTGKFAGHPNPDIVGKPITEFLSSTTVSALAKGEQTMETFVSKVTGKETQTVFLPIELGKSGKSWHIAVGVPVDEIMAQARYLRNISIVIALITMVILVAALYYIVGAVIIRPVNQVVNGLNDIAQGEGDTTKRLETISSDEIGDLARAFNLFMDKLQELLSTISGNAQQVDQAATDLAELAKGLAAGAGDTSEKSHSVAAATEQMNTNISSVAAAMEEASANINMVASATEEMSSTINEIAGNSEKARSISEDAVSKTQSASGRMTELGRAAQEIGKVTDTINDISEQTNLLALNATIEAARAGDAGKGFAVVASEIKDLARQTAEATNDIKAKIDGIQSSAQGSVSEIADVARVIEDVNDIVTTIASAVEEQSIATQEISGNIGNASTGVAEVGENMSQISSVSSEIAADITQVNTLAEDMSTDSIKVNDNAGSLSQLSGRLKELLSTFKI